MAADRVYYTAKGETVYAIVFGSVGTVRVKGAGRVRDVSLLGASRKLEWKQQGDDVEVTMPAFLLGDAPCEHALTLKLVK